MEQWRAAIGSYNASMSCRLARARETQRYASSTCSLPNSGRLVVTPLSQSVLPGCLPFQLLVSFLQFLVMGVGVGQWRVAISPYNRGRSCSLAHSSSSSSSRVPVLLSFSLLCCVAITSLQSVMKVLMLLILLSGDVERNPGPDIMGELAVCCISVPFETFIIIRIMYMYVSNGSLTSWVS